MRHLEGQLEEKNQELQRVCPLSTSTSMISLWIYALHTKNERFSRSWVVFKKLWTYPVHFKEIKLLAI